MFTFHKEFNSVECYSNYYISQHFVNFLQYNQNKKTKKKEK